MKSWSKLQTFVLKRSLTSNGQRIFWWSRPLLLFRGSSNGEGIRRQSEGSSMITVDLNSPEIFDRYPGNRRPFGSNLPEVIERCRRGLQSSRDRMDTVCHGAHPSRRWSCGQQVCMGEKGQAKRGWVVTPQWCIKTMPLYSVTDPHSICFQR